MSMKLTKTPTDSLFRDIKCNGLFSVRLDYKVASATGTFDYQGPKIPKEMWEQILSFFKWTYDTYKSEAQVRLFVSPNNGTWKAWAFPQEGDTGLSTKEIENDERRKQRASLFEKDEEWIAWGTVHHHCGISAFQSGTDESDEEGQGGLHMTVGDLDRPIYSLHCRLYHQKDQWQPDMSLFWDIGEALTGLPIEVAALLPKDSQDLIARQQMCVPASVEFPEQWKKNYIIRPPIETPKFKSNGQDTFFHGAGDHFGGHNSHMQSGGGNFSYKTEREKAFEALDDLTRFPNPEITTTELVEALDELMDEPYASIIQACLMNEVEPEALMKAIEQAKKDAGEDDKSLEPNQGDPNWVD